MLWLPGAAWLWDCICLEFGHAYSQCRCAVCRTRFPNMQQWRVSIQAGVAVAFLAALTPQLAKGDGGVMLLHESRGAFLVTVFVSPEAARGGLTDLSVLVQSSTSGDVLLDANVGLAVAAPKGQASTPSEEFCSASSAAAVSQSSDVGELQGPVPATREQASHKLL